MKYKDFSKQEDLAIYEDMRKEITQKSILRIAELKINAYKLNCTPKQYIKKCTK